MSTPDNFLNSGTQNFATAGNWSAGVPNINDDAKIELAAKTTVNMNAEEGANSISIGSNDDLEINGVIFDVASGTSAINGNINVNDGSTLALKGAGVANSGAINLNSTGSTTKIEVVPAGLGDTGSNTTITGGGAGTLSTIALGGPNGTGDVFDDQIVSDGADNVTLTLVGETIVGNGTIGDSHLTLDVGSGSVIDSDISILAANASVLTLNTGSNTIMNAGTLETTNGGQMNIDSPVDNTGTILSSGEGNLILSAPVTGPGAVDIGAGSILDIEAGSVSGNVSFTGGGAQLFMLPGEVGGDITGMVPSDTIFLGGLGFAGALRGFHPVWQQTSSTGGTLSLYKNGVDAANLNFAGQFNSLDFVLGTFGRTDETISVRSTPVYAQNPGNNDEWILSDGNWVESAGPGSHPTGYNVALTGAWTGGGTDGILWFDPSTGDTDEWQLSNTQWSNTVDLTTHPTNTTDNNSFQIVGTDNATHFFGNGIDDVLWTSTNADGTIATDIWQLNSSGQWTPTPGGSSPGPHPAGYVVAGTGDWTGSGTDGIMWFNPTTGDTDEWILSNGQWAGSNDLGPHPLNTDNNSYQIAGIGDFFDNGRDGVLWTSVNSDGTIATDIWELNSSGQWMASISPGTHPAGYSVVGVGDFTGTGTSDILWFNPSTGDTDEWLINNGQWAGSIDLGPHTPSSGWNVAGVGDFNGAGNASILWHSPS